MKGNGRIAGYAVNRKTISVQIELSGATAVVDELERYKGKMKTIRLDTFQVVGKIESITIRRSVGFLIHAARLDFINRRLFRLMEKESLDHRGEHAAAGQAALPPRYDCQEAESEAGGPPVRAVLFQKKRRRRTGKDNPRQEVGLRSLGGPVERRLRQDQEAIGHQIGRSMFETVRTIIAILREKEPPAEKIVLSLDDLCPIWIKYNSSFKPAAVVKEPAEAAASGPEETAIPAPSSESAPVVEDQPASGKALMTVQAFYSEVIEPHKEALSGMLEGINRIMETSRTVRGLSLCRRYDRRFGEKSGNTRRRHPFKGHAPGPHLQRRPHRPPASQGRLS